MLNAAPGLIYMQSRHLINCVIYMDLSLFNSVSNRYQKQTTDQGPVVQSAVSLTSLLRVISLTVLAQSIYNIPIFFAEKM